MTAAVMAGLMAGMMDKFGGGRRRSLGGIVNGALPRFNAPWGTAGGSGGNSSGSDVWRCDRLEHW